MDGCGQQSAVDKNGVQFGVDAIIQLETDWHPKFRRVRYFENGWPCVRVNGIDECWDPSAVEVKRLSDWPASALSSIRSTRSRRR
jgi:hypothetical protein